ncbi:MAG: nucleotidyltransferase family protein [Acidobacteriota bacterium]|nr:nucleotidyltransferase family protein [Acidobacteriota bacterium]
MPGIVSPSGFPELELSRIFFLLERFVMSVAQSYQREAYGKDFQQVLLSPVLTYEEGLDFFESKGMLNETLQKLVNDLEAHHIDYAVIGAMALNQHGYHRFTSDIDLLMTKDGLERFHQELVGLGYVAKFAGAKKTFRAIARNVPIEVITSGEYPGDGLPKPISFPDPSDNLSESFVVINGVKTLTLEMLINLKLASGMTNAGRLKDLADVQELIKIRNLDAAFADNLHQFVRERYLELHRGAAMANESE